MKPKDLLDPLWRGLTPGRRQDPRDPDRLAALLGLGDVHVATGRIRHHEPGQRGSEDEPNDEQPPVELPVQWSVVVREWGERVMRGPV